MDESSSDDRQTPWRTIRQMMREPVYLAAGLGLYLGGALLVANLILRRNHLDVLDFLSDPTFGLLIFTVSGVIFVSRYLGIFQAKTPAARPFASADDKETSVLLREIRNYMAHSRPSSGPPAQVNIDEDFKGQLLARLTTESQNALGAFVESEVFKKAAEVDEKQQSRAMLVSDIDQMLTTYQLEMGSWRKNANVNLMIGLLCAIAGIAVMWQTLITLNFELEAGVSWKVSDLYKFLARFGLVLIIESVAFFFLKLYREDRSMIRYLRNEITNLEARYLSLKTALAFGTAADLAKVLQSLSTTERNFLVKKGDRVISDMTYENSEIMLEKILSRFPELFGRVKPATAKPEA